MRYQLRTAAGRVAPLVAAALAAALLVSSCAEIDLLKALRARMADADYIYVSAEGSDDNTGITPDSPFKTIARGLAVADSAEAYEVRVAGGEYVVENETDIIEVPEDVALKGGWSSDFSEWAPRDHVTTIKQGDGDASVLVTCTVDDDRHDDCFERSFIVAVELRAARIPVIYADRDMSMNGCVVTVGQSDGHYAAIHLVLSGSCSSGMYGLTNNIIRTDADTAVIAYEGDNNGGINMRCNTIIATGNAVYLAGGGNSSALDVRGNILGAVSATNAAIKSDHQGDCLCRDNLIFGFDDLYDGNQTLDASSNDLHGPDIAGEVFASGLDTDLSDGDDTDYPLDDPSQLYAVDQWGGGDGSVGVDFEGDPRPYPEEGDYDRGADEKAP